jgi:hypothetical protein
MRMISTCSCTKSIQIPKRGVASTNTISSDDSDEFFLLYCSWLHRSGRRSRCSSMLMTTVSDEGMETSCVLNFGPVRGGWVVAEVSRAQQRGQRKKRGAAEMDLREWHGDLECRSLKYLSFVATSLHQELRTRGPPLQQLIIHPLLGFNNHRVILPIAESTRVERCRYPHYRAATAWRRCSKPCRPCVWAASRERASVPRMFRRH